MCCTAVCYVSSQTSVLEIDTDAEEQWVVSNLCLTSIADFLVSMCVGSWTGLEMYVSNETKRLKQFITQESTNSVCEYLRQFLKKKGIPKWLPQRLFTKLDMPSPELCLHRRSLPTKAVRRLFVEASALVVYLAPCSQHKNRKTSTSWASHMVFLGFRRKLRNEIRGTSKTVWRICAIFPCSDLGPKRTSYNGLAFWSNFLWLFMYIFNLLISSPKCPTRAFYAFYK